MENKIISKQRFCYILRLYPQYFHSDGWTDEANETVGKHFNYLKKYTEEGTLILAGRTVNEPMSAEDFGIAILETASKEEAQNIMDNDPAVVGKIMYAKLYDFSLALMRK